MQNVVLREVRPEIVPAEEEVGCVLYDQDLERLIEQEKEAPVPVPVSVGRPTVVAPPVPYGWD